MIRSLSECSIGNTNELSILRSVIGSRRRFASEKYPVPKSATDSRMPRLDTRRVFAIARSGSAMIIRSVISSDSASAGVPADAHPRDVVGEAAVQQVAGRQVD